MIAHRVVCLASLVIVGCGGAAASSTNSGSTDPTDGPSAASETAGDEAVADAGAASCGVWDPAADPTEAPADVAAPPEGASRSASGIRFCILRRGESEVRPTREDEVRV